MSRSGGFARADVDTSFLDDPKLRAVRRRLRGTEGGAVNAAMCYVTVMLESWRFGERLTLAEAAPEWLEVGPGVAEALVAEGLLDKQQRIPAKVWQDWFGAADARRRQRREAGSSGGTATAARRGERSSSDAASGAAAGLQRTVASRPVTSYPDSPNLTVPSSPARARGRARGNGSIDQGPQSLRELLPTPPGYPKEDLPDANGA